MNGILYNLAELCDYLHQSITQLGTFLSLHLALGVKIALVANEQLNDRGLGKSVDFLDPRFNMVEGVTVGHIVYDDDAVGTSVVGGCESAEAFLSGGVPLLRDDTIWSRMGWESSMTDLIFW